MITGAAMPGGFGCSPLYFGDSCLLSAFSCISSPAQEFCWMSRSARKLCSWQGKERSSGSGGMLGSWAGGRYLGTPLPASRSAQHPQHWDLGFFHVASCCCFSLSSWPPLVLHLWCFSLLCSPFDRFLCCCFSAQYK